MRISDWSSDVCSSDLYPSSSLHRVEPVTRGARLASFFWVQSLIRNDAQRRMLFELDASIQALTQSGADRRSEERRVGKEFVSTCRSRRSPVNAKKKRTTPLRGI